MLDRPPFHTAAMMGAALIAFSLSSCDTIKSAGAAAAKPFKAAGSAVGETVKKANPMRLFNKKEEQGGLAAAQPDSELAAADGTAPVQWPSQNTATPGAQPDPGAGNTARSTLSLPSRPDSPQPALPSLPQQDPLPPVAAPTLPPLTLEQPITTPPVEPLFEPEPLSAPVIKDDGFIQLAPKLPDEESPLPPQ